MESWLGRGGSGTGEILLIKWVCWAAAATAAEAVRITN